MGEIRRRSWTRTGGDLERGSGHSTPRLRLLRRAMRDERANYRASCFGGRASCFVVAGGVTWRPWSELVNGVLNEETNDIESKLQIPDSIILIPKPSSKSLLITIYNNKVHKLNNFIQK